MGRLRAGEVKRRRHGTAIFSRDGVQRAAGTAMVARATAGGGW